MDFSYLRVGLPLMLQVDTVPLLKLFSNISFESFKVMGLAFIFNIVKLSPDLLGEMKSARPYIVICSLGDSILLPIKLYCQLGLFQLFKEHGPHDILLKYFNFMWDFRTFVNLHEFIENGSPVAGDVHSGKLYVLYFRISILGLYEAEVLLVFI